MPKVYNIKLIRRVRVGKETPYKTLILEATIQENPFNDHDTAAMLFALEFSVNNHCELPLRCHVEEVPQ